VEIVFDSQLISMLSSRMVTWEKPLVNMQAEEYLWKDTRKGRFNPFFFAL
jgi:hypothetical protein